MAAEKLSPEAAKILAARKAAVDELAAIDNVQRAVTDPAVIRLSNARLYQAAITMSVLRGEAVAAAEYKAADDMVEQARGNVHAPLNITLEVVKSTDATPDGTGVDGHQKCRRCGWTPPPAEFYSRCVRCGWKSGADNLAPWEPPGDDDPSGGVDDGAGSNNGGASGGPAEPAAARGVHGRFGQVKGKHTARDKQAGSPENRAKPAPAARRKSNHELHKAFHEGSGMLRGDQNVDSERGRRCCLVHAPKCCARLALCERRKSDAFRQSVSQLLIGGDTWTRSSTRSASLSKRSPASMRRRCAPVIRQSVTRLSIAPTVCAVNWRWRVLEFLPLQT
jgi:hypothetical protein